MIVSFAGEELHSISEFQISFIGDGLNSKSGSEPKYPSQKMFYTLNKQLTE